MESNNELKEINSKNCTCYCFYSEKYDFIYNRINYLIGVKK